MHTINDAEFTRFQRFIFEAAGITLSPAKKALVAGRLAKRLQHREMQSFSDYLRLLEQGSEATEVQMAVDLLTTNETYFFRESRHFDLLRQWAVQASGQGRALNVWSAACSSGEEVYSLAMVLQDCQPGLPWSVLGSDISTRVLARAQSGHYPLERTQNIPPAYLKRFCRKGQGDHDGTLLVDRALRDRVQFAQVNLNTDLPQLGPFDLIFLRNVMIYFNQDTRRRVVQRVLSVLKPGGHFCIGHSESLHDICSEVVSVAPAVYRKP